MLQDSVYHMTMIHGHMINRSPCKYFIAFKVDTISINNYIVVTDMVRRLQVPKKCYVTCGHIIFMT